MRSKVVVALTLALACTMVNGKAPDLVEAKWGVPNSMATVGRLFRLHVSSDAFTGPVQSIKVETEDGSEMPKWLEFDPRENVLFGIPTPRDKGDINLKVIAKGPSNEYSSGFTLEVRDVPSYASGVPLKFKPTAPEDKKPEFVRCKRHEPETVATIIVDVDFDQMVPSDRIAFLKKFLGHMDLQEEMIKVLPVGNSPMYDSNALVSGSGDAIAAKTAGTFLAWPVGCGQVKVHHFPILQRLDDDSSSGRMAKVMGHPIIGWHVTNSHIQTPKRKKRAVLATATPAMTPVAPTATMTDKVEKTEDAGEKMTHTVVDMATPTVIQPTSTQPEMPKTTEPTEPPTTTTTTTTTKKPTTPKPVPTDPPTTPKKETTPIQPTITYTEESTEVPVVPTCETGKAPMVKDPSPIPTLKYNVGDIIDFVIPEDTFEDCEVGGTRGLDLKLFREGLIALGNDSFFQFDSENQKIIGLVMSGDKGTVPLTLVASKDQQNGSPQVTNLNFKLKVKGSSALKKKNHELSAILDLDYPSFKADIKQQTLLATKIASLYGDSNADNLLITKLEAGSVVFGWANKSVSADGCPVGEISNAVNKIATEDGLTPEAVEKMKPFKLQGFSAAPAGSCEGVAGFPERKIDNRPPKTTEQAVTEPPKTDAKPTEKATDSEEPVKSDVPPAKPTDTETTTEKAQEEKAAQAGSDALVTTVIPAVIIVVVLLIALLVACICYRKKRKGKLTVEEQDNFVNKGAPVIFPDELGDKPNDVNKPLLVEGNAGPPPEYHRGGTDESLNNGTTLTHEDDIQEYEPPTPPVTDSTSNKPRPSQPTPYSSPPEILP